LSVEQQSAANARIGAWNPRVRAAILVEYLEQHDLEVYIDGGWAVDALLGEHTRSHADLDIAVPHKFVPRLRELLAAREHLTGEGFIDGYPVRCISPEWLVKFHTGYDLDENDFRDVRSLCERFGIPLPDEYLRFISRRTSQT